MSLRSKLTAIDKDLGLDKRHKVEEAQLETYVQTQVNEMKAVLTRLRVDVLLNQEIPVDGKIETEGRDKKISELKNDIEQMSSAVNVLQALLDEIAK